MKTQRFFTANMRVSDLARVTNHLCAWKGCAKTAPVEQVLPPGWRWLALWRGPVTQKPWAPACRQDRDAVLCPEHAQLLHYELLKDIGQRLDETKGRA